MIRLKVRKGSDLYDIVSLPYTLRHFHRLDQHLADERDVAAEFAVADDVLDARVAVVARGYYRVRTDPICSALTLLLFIRESFQGGPQSMSPPPAWQQ